MIVLHMGHVGLSVLHGLPVGRLLLLLLLLQLHGRLSVTNMESQL